jgi:hypothetical protein
MFLGVFQHAEQVLNIRIGRGQLSSLFELRTSRFILVPPHFVQTLVNLSCEPRRQDGSARYTISCRTLARVPQIDINVAGRAARENRSVLRGGLVTQGGYLEIVFTRQHLRKCGCRVVARRDRQMHAFPGREFDNGIPGEGHAGRLLHANQDIHRRIIRDQRGRTAGPLSDRRRQCSTGWTLRAKRQREKKPDARSQNAHEKACHRNGPRNHRICG